MARIKIMENKMKYIINYTKEGKILGFVKSDTDLNIEVSNTIWFEAQGYNKIIINGENVSFDKVDFRTPEELDIQRIQAIKSKAGELINSKYPDYKQLNIIRVGGSELDAMTAYIDRIRAISNEAESNGTKVEDVQWL